MDYGNLVNWEATEKSEASIKSSRIPGALRIVVPNPKEKWGYTDLTGLDDESTDNFDVHVPPPGWEPEWRVHPISNESYDASPATRLFLLPVPAIDYRSGWIGTA